MRCPGCYAYEDNHLGGLVTLRQLNDRKGDPLVTGILEVVDRLKPLHVSLVGGDPLVRYREMEAVIPQLLDRGIHVQLVTSAFRRMHPDWPTFKNLRVVVSIDGLAPDHDVRRKPATYERILNSISDQRITVHCTITGPMMKRSGYLEEFLDFWSSRNEIDRVWFSIFTPQKGAELVEILTRSEREQVVRELLDLRKRYRKLDMPEGMVKEFLHPPSSPDQCIFAQTTETISADLRTRVTPCQFGGEPDCSQCGCIASMGLAAIGSFKLGGFIPVGSIFTASHKVGMAIRQFQLPKQPIPEVELK